MPQRATVLRPAAPIETTRLTLRPLTPADFDDVHAYYSRPEVARYLYWEACDPEQTREMLDRNIQRVGIENDGDGLVLGVVWREVGRVVGHVSLMLARRKHRQGEIGFILNPDYQGRGLATEAAVVMLDLGFDGLGLHRIEGHCDARNVPSARVMERLGMRREAHLRENEIFKGEWGDELYFAILEDEWRSGGA
jgi:RimJ/RimL family protein N-acetyltransferase